MMPHIQCDETGTCVNLNRVSNGGPSRVTLELETPSSKKSVVLDRSKLSSLIAKAMELEKVLLVEER